MEFRNLGRSGLKVSEVSLGGNNFGWWADEQTSITVINKALDMGINFIDTADVYDMGRSEEFIGKAVKGKRQQVIIATKVGSPMGEGPNERGVSRYYIMKAVDASLRRLNTDYIDLYYIHWPDPTTPIKESLRALDDLVRVGKVCYIGCSNFAAWQLCEALWTSKINNLESFIVVQPRYNLLARGIEEELVPCCQAYGIGVVPWGPLASGFLTGKYRRGEEISPDMRLLPGRKFTTVYQDVITDANFDKLAKFEAFAKERGHSVGELAIAWLLSRPWLSTIIAGAKNTKQLAENVAGAEWKLTSDEVAQVDQLSQ